MSGSLLAAVLAGLVFQEAAPGGGADLDALAKKLSNPVASLVSLPFQGNMDEGLGRDDHGRRYSLNIQPVMPMSIGDDWNLITRVILPIISQEDVFPDSHQSGLGDTIVSFFFSPKEPGPGGLIWGLGPVFLVPTATDDLLGAEQYGFGPTAVALVQSGVFTFGALANHIWASEGEEGPKNVSTTFLQPFVSMGVAKGMTATLNLESSLDWKAREWTVPINLSLSQVLPINGQLVSFSLGVRYYLDKPEGGPDWGLRFAVTFLFPK